MANKPLTKQEFEALLTKSAQPLPKPEPLVMLCYFLAVRALNSLWVASLEQELKASIIGRELLIEVFNRILISFHFLPLTNKYSTNVTVCQGIVTLKKARMAVNYQ
jgi:hypothetical protein